MLTRLEFTFELSRTLKERFVALPGADEADDELEEAASTAAFLIMMTTALEETGNEHAAEGVRHFSGKLEEIIEALPIETPSDLTNILAEGRAALVLRGFAPTPGANGNRMGSVS